MLFRAEAGAKSARTPDQTNSIGSLDSLEEKVRKLAARSTAFSLLHCVDLPGGSSELEEGIFLKFPMIVPESPFLLVSHQKSLQQLLQPFSLLCFPVDL